MSSIEPDNHEEVDDEIAEIFVEEATEVLEEIHQHFPVWQAQPDQTTASALKDLRRAFHTLKGSGRLVKAMVLGELAWSIESLLNRVLDGHVTPGSQVVATVASAIELIPELVSAFQEKRGARIDRVLIDNLMTRAQALAKGEAVIEAASLEAGVEFASETISEAEMKAIDERIDKLDSRLENLLLAIEQLQKHTGSLQQQTGELQEQVNSSERLISGYATQGVVTALDQKLTENSKLIKELQASFKASKTDGEHNDLKNDLKNRLKEQRLGLETAHQELRNEISQARQETASIKSSVAVWAIGSALVCSSLAALAVFLMLSH